MTETPKSDAALPESDMAPQPPETETAAPKKPRLDPTRYGDWELNGKCVDF